MADMNNEKLRTHVEELLRNLEDMPATYKAHVHAKKCVEHFWSSIQPVISPVVPNGNGETGGREADPTA